MPTTAPTDVLTERFTRRDYALLPEGFPAELIEGGFVREPSPTYWHQRLLLRIARRLEEEAEPDRVVLAPADVVLDEWNVLQPDVLVRAEGDAVTGPSAVPTIPVLVVEVTSPATASRDRDRKAGIYLRGGVAEVWIVDPEAGTVEVQTPSGISRHAGADAASSRVLPGFRISWAQLSASPPRPAVPPGG